MYGIKISDAMSPKTVILYKLGITLTVKIVAII